MKILWGRAAGRCAFPDCRLNLLIDETEEEDPIYNMGEIAHVEASSDNGPRPNPSMDSKTRDSYHNLILLCKNCHGRIDTQKKKYSLEVIREMKKQHEAWVRASLPERGTTKTGWKTISLHGYQPIDICKIEEAIEPDYIDGDVVDIGVDLSTSWFELLQNRTIQSLGVEDCYSKRFAIFPLAPVSACISFGYLLTNRPNTRLFQHHHQERNWKWKTQDKSDAEFQITGLPENPISSRGSLCIAFSISRQVTNSDINAICKNKMGIVEIKISRPSRYWLKNEQQMTDAYRQIGELFEECLHLFSNASKWHLFPAVPAPIAVAIGQQINPTMFPQIQLYEFDSNKTPSYRKSIVLKESLLV
jgi:hypothetical protein